MRWGVDNLTVLVSAVLHDVVEDCADDIQADYEKPAIDVIEDLFGTAVAVTVAMLTNPASVAGATRVERNAQYVEHVALVIGDPFVLLVKFSDFADNALSLHHHTHIDGMTQRLAQKYLPLVPEFDRALRMLEARGGSFADVAQQMLRALGKNRLVELAGVVR
jgi:(p)ppGpp synthase/HD superfamily hydrolase